MKPKNGRDVGRFVLNFTFNRLKHNVRQIDTHHIEAIAWQVVHLGPHETAACTGFVLNDGVDGAAFLFEHHLLMSCRQIRFTAGWEGLPIHEVLLRTRRHGLRSCVLWHESCQTKAHCT